MVFDKQRWKMFLGLCLPAIMGGIAETATQSINAALAARLGAVVSAAFDLSSTLFGFCIALVACMCSAIGVFMANHLGRGHPNKAKGIMKVGLVYTYTLVTLMSLIFYLVIDIYAGIVSNDPKVIEELQEQ